MKPLTFDYLKTGAARTAMWHEAGHAAVATAMGARVRYVGLDPIPHALVAQRGLTKHQKGVLLAAGGAFTRAVYGHEWGTAVDYKMAAALGDLDTFRMEAQVLAEALLPEAKFIVEGRLGKLGMEDYIPDMGEDHPDYARYVDIVERARLGKFMKWFIGKYAAIQTKHPRRVAKFV